MKRSIIVAAVAATTLIAPAAASAATPTGEVVIKTTAQGENASSIGIQSSNIKQNGQFVSGADNVWNMDQTTIPGSRAALVQAALGH